MKLLIVLVASCTVAGLAIAWSLRGECCVGASDTVSSAATYYVAAKPVSASGYPRAEINQPGIDFGVVEPLRAHRHTFEIRNVGTAPLTLASHGATCKCLKIEIADATIAPGETGQIAVVWEASATENEMFQRATIGTNDPANAKIDVTVKGRIRLLLAAEPPTLTVARIKPHEKAEASTTIVSQVWDAFTIEHLHSSLDGVTWQLLPASPQELRRLNAKSGWRLMLTYPSNMASGTIKESLRFTAQPLASASNEDRASDPLAEPQEREIPVGGTVLRRLAVYGKDIQPWGTIEAGKVDSQRGYEAQFVLKVNDQEPELRVKTIETMPDFVEARVEPYAAGKRGLYRLHVGIPGSGVPGVYQGDNQGRIRVKFDHPRIEPLELGIEFVVTKPSPRRLGSSDIALAGGR